jgi:hypothetical protein
MFKHLEAGATSMPSSEEKRKVDEIESEVQQFDKRLRVATQTDSVSDDVQVSGIWKVVCGWKPRPIGVL